MTSLYPRNKYGSCCVVPGCSFRSGTNALSKIRMFSFPGEPSLRSLWIRAIGRENWQPSHSSRICSRHFFQGSPSKDPMHPDWVPSIFPMRTEGRVTGKPKMQKLEFPKRHQQKKQVNGKQTTSSSNDIIHQRRVAANTTNNHNNTASEQPQSDSDYVITAVKLIEDRIEEKLVQTTVESIKRQSEQSQAPLTHPLLEGARTTETEHIIVPVDMQAFTDASIQRATQTDVTSAMVKALLEENAALKQQNLALTSEIALLRMQLKVAAPTRNNDAFTSLLASPCDVIQTKRLKFT